MIPVTPLLFVGHPPRNAIPCETAEQAMKMIDVGVTAIVPTMELARETLLLLGTSEEWADARIHFGLTGEWQLPLATC